MNYKYSFINQLKLIIQLKNLLKVLSINEFGLEVMKSYRVIYVLLILILNKYQNFLYNLNICL